MININASELIELLESTPNTQNIMLSGKHGIGKSCIIEQYFTEKGIPVVIMFLGQMSDPGDLIGLPHKDTKTNKTDFLPPYWFPTDNKPIVLFLDELNRARPEILQTIMDLVLNKTLAGKKLPEGSQVITAVNHGDEYQLTDLDPALVSRFNVYNFTPTPSEWLIWAEKNNIDQRVIKFIEENKNFLDSDGLSNDNEDDMEKSPNRRSWQWVSELLPNLDIRSKFAKKAIAGIIGVRIASLFLESITDDHLISAKEILNDFQKCKSKLKEYKLFEMAIVNENIFRFFETEDIEENKKNNILKQFRLFVKFLFNLDSNEFMAHFISLFESTNYPNTNLFIIKETPEIYKEITNFIKNL